MKWFNKQNKERVGFFIIHGFLGNSQTAYSTLPMLLDKNGIYDYRFVSVQGHGEGDDINDFNYEKALDDIENQYIEYKEHFDKIYLMGFSMGGALATHLAVKFGADKMVLISPALKYGGTKRISSKAFTFFKSSKVKPTDTLNVLMKRKDAKEIIDEYIKSETGDNIGGKEYREFIEKHGGIKPIVFLNFMKLIATIKKGINKNINVPTRIYISEHDDLVPTDSAFYVLENVIHTDKRANILSHVKHGIMTSYKRKEVIAEILKFLYDKENVKWL